MCHLPFKAQSPPTAPRIACIVYLFLLMIAAKAQAQEHKSAGPIAEARTLLSAGQYKEAKTLFEQTLKADKHSVPALVGLGELEMQRRNWPKAKDKLDEAISIEPANLSARYLRGISNREIAKFRVLNQARFWDNAKIDFDFILDKDSSYKDVLSQVALWNRYQDNFREAILIGHDQLAIKPDSTMLEFDLVRLYQYLLRHESNEEALAWLSSRERPIDLYFKGELLRRQGELIKADDIFSDLLFSKSDIIPQLPLLSRAKVSYQQSSEKVAQSYVTKAIQQIDHALHAQVMLDEIKHIITDRELALYNSLSTNDTFSAFFEAFWAKRDPMPARPVNVRMTEHYRRLLFAEKEYAYDGFRLWHNDPDKTGALKFPAAYQLNEEFNDKGLIYIRHGEPYDTEIQIGGDLEYRSVIDNTSPYGAPVEHSTNQGWQPNESWRYVLPERMDFHFVLAGGGENAWRLVPSITNIDILISREHWGPIYSQMAEAARDLRTIKDLANPGPQTGDMTIASLDEEAQGEFARSQDSLVSTSTGARAVDMGLMSSNSRKYLEFSSLERDMVDQSSEAVALALSTDQHTWVEEIKPIPMPYQIATFRGSSDSTRVEIYFALPIGKITEQLLNTRKTLDMEVGYSFHDTTWSQVLRYAEAKRFPTHPDEAAAVIDFFSFSVPADSYHVSLFSNPLQTVQQSGFKFDYRIPSYAERSLSMSDILIADYIGPAQSGSRFDRGDMHISPNPFHRFSGNQSVFVYFEVYDLVFGTDDQTSFSVEYILGTKNRKKGLFRRKDRPILTLEIDRSSATLSPVEYAEIDVSKVDPGEYYLRIRITDKNSGKVVEKASVITLQK